MSDVFVRVDELIRELLPELEGEISLAASFEDLGMDSMTMVDLLVNAEQAFNLKIPDSEVADLDTVQRLVECVEVHQHRELA